jgi:hypothetical protein
MMTSTAVSFCGNFGWSGGLDHKIQTTKKTKGHLLWSWNVPSNKTSVVAVAAEATGITEAVESMSITMINGKEISSGHDRFKDDDDDDGCSELYSDE